MVANIKVDPFPKLQHKCPICDSQVYLTGITEWEIDTGKVIQAEYECETEPDIDSDEWPDWRRGHYRMPYVDWMPWEINVLEWLNKHFRYDGERLITR